MATYYVDATSGLDANDGLSEAGAWKTITKLNATTFSAGDTINLKKGETWTGMWTFLGSGTSGNEITITSYGTGAQPVINANSANARALYLNGNDYVIINGLHLKNATAYNFEAAGTTDGIQFINNTTTGGANQVIINSGASCTVSGNTINKGTGYAVSFQQATNSSGILSNNSFVGNGTANTATVMAYIRGSTMEISDNTVTSWVMGGATPQLFNIACTGVTVRDNTVSDSNGYNFYVGGSGVVFSGTNTSTRPLGHGFNFISAGMTSVDTLVVTSALSSSVTFTSTTGTFTVQNIQVTDAPVSSAIIANGASVALTINHIDLDGGDGVGVEVGTSATVTILGGEVKNFAVDGLSTDTAGRLSNYYVYSHHNGTPGLSGSGDGFTAHGLGANASTHSLRYCIASNNMKSGAAMIHDSTGVIYNSTFYNNYENSIEDDYGILISGNANYTVKNNITMGHRYEIYKSATATLTTDYNLFYDSRGGLAFIWNGVAYNWADYLTNSSQDVNSINDNPMFKNAGGGNFKLSDSSPAINGGVDLSLTRDFTGVTVPQHSDPCIGAHEYIGTLVYGMAGVDNSKGTTKVHRP